VAPGGRPPARGRLFALVDLVDRLEQEKAAWRRFYRFFQHVELDGAMTARVAADLLGGGMGGKPWVLAMDRTNWEFGKTTIQHPDDFDNLERRGRSADLDAAAS